MHAPADTLDDVIDDLDEIVRIIRTDDASGDWAAFGIWHNRETSTFHWIADSGRAADDEHSFGITVTDLTELESGDRLDANGAFIDWITGLASLAFDAGTAAYLMNTTSTRLSDAHGGRS